MSLDEFELLTDDEGCDWRVGAIVDKLVAVRVEAREEAVKIAAVEMGVRRV